MNSQIANVLLLFGMAGAGKTYVGELVSRKMGYLHYELDRDLTPAMHAAIAANRSFTDAERDEFFASVSARMRQVLTHNPKVVFTQGVYKERHRESLRRQIPGLETIWVKAPREIVQARLHRRDAGVSPDYAEMIERNFEVPLSGRVLINDEVSEATIWDRFTALFA